MGMIAVSHGVFLFTNAAAQHSFWSTEHNCTISLNYLQSLYSMESIQRKCIVLSYTTPPAHKGDQSNYL